MISISLKKRGAATLVMTLILLLLITLIIVFAANFGVMQDRAIANLDRNNQAYEAAEAGLEYGINYLKENNAVILANPVSGYLAPYTNSSITDVTLANNSKFTVVYTNPVAFNYQLIRVTSTGTNADGSSTRVVKQDVERGSILLNPPNIPLQSIGDVKLKGGSKVINLESNTTIQSGGEVNLEGSSSTISAGGGSTPLVMGPDIQENNAALAGISDDDYFATVFGVSGNAIKNQVEHYYTSNTTTDYSNQLNGLTGTSIWIDQTAGTAKLSGLTVIGSITNPVLMVINGDMRLGGTVIIYGFVFFTGDASIEDTGNVTIVGSAAVGASTNITLSGSSQIVYSSSIINNLEQLDSMTYYAKVPGSWKDF